MTETAAGSTAKFKEQFKAQFRKFDIINSSHTWKGLKVDAGIQSAPWWKKSNNVGPKMNEAERLLEVFNNQMNLRNYKQLRDTVSSVVKALKAFQTNREIPDTKAGHELKRAVEQDFLKRYVAFEAFLKTNEANVVKLDKAELNQVLRHTGVAPARR